MFAAQINCKVLKIVKVQGLGKEKKCMKVIFVSPVSPGIIIKH